MGMFLMKLIKIKPLSFLLHYLLGYLPQIYAVLMPPIAQRPNIVTATGIEPTTTYFVNADLMSVNLRSANLF